MHKHAFLLLLSLVGCAIQADQSPRRVEQSATCTPDPDACACEGGNVQACESGTVVNKLLTLSAAGLFTNPNPVGAEVPDGAMSRAVNVVSDRPGIVTAVRGQKALDYTLSGGYGEAGRSAFFYKNALMVHTDADKLRRDTGSEFVAEQAQAGGDASVVAPTQFDVGARVRFAESTGKLYMTTASGILEKDGLTAPLRRPGATHAYDVNRLEYMMTGSGVGSGHLLSGGVTAYRVVWGFNDSQGRPVLGEPSGRRIIKNPVFSATLSRTSNVVTASIAPAIWPTNFEPFTGFKVDITPIDTNNTAPARKTVVSATSSAITYSETGADFSSTSTYTLAYPPMNTEIDIPIPSEVRVGDFLQVYRTASVVSPYDDPGDNMAQVGEVIITSAMKSAGMVGFIDNTPDSLRGRPLYTNATQEGLLQANARPPIARDMVTFRDCLFLANTIGPMRLTIRFLGNPEYGDSITIAGKTYVGGEFESGIYGYEINKDPARSTSQQIEATARSLVATINGTFTGSIVTAYYASSDTDPPGIIVLESKVIDNEPFTAIASANGDRFEPQLVSAISSTQDVRPNRLHFSKQGQPYAFPLGNTLAIGDESTPITRVLALRESLFVFKDGVGEGKGVWRVTGSGPGAWSVSAFNFGAHLVAPESAVVVDNQVFGLFAAGVASVSDSGVDTISVPIEDKMQKLLAVADDTVGPVSFGLSYEVGAERKFMVWVPDDNESVVPSQAYVYNLNTETWTTRDDVRTCGIVGGESSLMHLCGDNGQVYAERRTGSKTDYRMQDAPAGEVYSITGNTVSADLADLEVGQVVWGSGGVENAVQIQSIDLDAGTFTTSGPFPGVAGDFMTLSYPVNISVAWVVNSAGDASAQKQFVDTALLLEQPMTGPWLFSFTADLDPTVDTAEGWAEGTPYVRVDVPWESQRTTRLGVQVDHAVGAELVNILGIRSNVNIYGGVLSR